MIHPAVVRLGTDQVRAEQAECGGKFRYVTAHERVGHAAEKVAENILEDVFTGPLGWSLAGVNNQVEPLPGCRIASGGVTLPRFTTHD